MTRRASILFLLPLCLGLTLCLGMTPNPKKLSAPKDVPSGAQMAKQVVTQLPANTFPIRYPANWDTNRISYLLTSPDLAAWTITLVFPPGAPSGTLEITNHLATGPQRLYYRMAQ